MKFTDRLNAKLHKLMTAYVMRQYDKKSRAVEKKHPELIKLSETKAKDLRRMMNET